MPLLLTALTVSPGIPGAAEKDYPTTLEMAAKEWATAMQAYVAGVIPPSVTVAAAASALEAALVGAFSAGSTSCAGLMDAAFQQFAATIAGGQLPLYTGVPPPAPVGFATIFAQKPAPGTRTEGVARVATKIDAWMRTGIGILVLPPKSPLPWS